MAVGSIIVGLAALVNVAESFDVFGRYKYRKSHMVFPAFANSRQMSDEPFDKALDIPGKIYDVLTLPGRLVGIGYRSWLRNAL